MVRVLMLVACLFAAVALPSAQAPAPAPVPVPAPAPVPAPTGGFSYNPQGRRDPFTSLLRRGSDPRGTAAGARPSGIAGLSVAELSLKGIVASRGGFVAIVQGSDTRTYIVREGERLLDGTVRRITQDTMLLFEQVKDPLSLEKQREVRKVLRQTDEAK